MKTRRRVEVLTITEKYMVARRHQPNVQRWCQLCDSQVRMLTPDETAIHLGVSTRSVFRAIEKNEFHFIETTEGKLFICQNSIQQISDSKAV